jgi:ABC-type transport system involved in multi-copper enzyme maturation permease subunit
MTPLLSLLIPIVVSAVFVFLASSIIHMLTPWHKHDLMKVPDEDGVMNALRAFRLPPGNYVFPKAASTADMKSPAFAEKMKAGPVAFMTVRSGFSFNMGGTLFQWFLYSLAVSVVAGYIAGVAFGPGTEYLRIMQVAGCVAFAGYSMAQMHESIWWGRRWSWTIRNMLDGLLYGLLTGGTFGWLWPR